MISEAERARRKARQVEAVYRWALAPVADKEERAAWEAIGWNPDEWMGKPWCGAWSAGLVDVGATGGPSKKYLKVMASSCDRLCGVGPAGSRGADYDPRRIRDEDGEAAAVAHELEPGCIITVGESGDAWGRHVTTVVRVVEGGILAIGGNQNGVSRLEWNIKGWWHARPVLGRVALSFYSWDELRCLIRCPDREYAGPVPVVTDEQVEQARALVDAAWDKARGVAG